MSFEAYWSVSLNILTLGLLGFHSAKKASLITVFWSAQILILFLSLSHLRSDFLLFGSAAINKANGLMIFGNLLFFLFFFKTYPLLPWIKKIKVKDVIIFKKEALFWSVWHIFIILFGIWNIIFNTTNLTGNSWLKTLNSPFAYNTFKITYLTAVPFIFLSLINKKISSLVLIPFLLIFSAYIGSRTLPAIIYCLFFMEFVKSMFPLKKNYLKKMINLILLATIFFTLHTGIRITRAYYFKSNLDPFSALKQELLFKRIATGINAEKSHGESKIMHYFYYIVSKDYKKPPYRSLGTILRVLLSPVPTSYSLGLKPENMIYQYARDYFDDGFRDNDPFYSFYESTTKKSADIKSSLHPVIWGDAYANLGTLGVICYALFFSAFFFFFDFFTKIGSTYTKTAATGIIGLSMLIVARGSVSIGANYTIHSTIVIAFIVLSTKAASYGKELWKTQRSQL